MGIAYNPRVVTDGLVLCLDAANPKGYDSTENLLTYSKDFSSGWSSSLTVTLNNAVAPDGTLTAAKIQRPLNSGNSNIQQNPVLSTNTNYCYSAFIKLASSPDPTNSICSLSSANNLISPVYASISYNFATGTISTFGNLPSNSGVIAYPDGWYRIYMVINTSTQTNASLEIRPASNNTVSDFYIWGAQLERGSSPSPYYPTSGTAKNRGTTWTDLSGRGNNGTLTGVGYNSANGGSLTFDGTDDEVICTNNASVQITVGTISAWFNANSGNSGYNGIIAKQNAWGLFVRDNLLVTYDWGNNVDRSTGITVGNSTWNYAVMTFTETIGTPSNNAIIYLNGSPVLTTTVKHSNHDQTVQVGEANAAQHFGGNIAQASIYNRALTAAEIQQNYNALKSRYQ